MYVRMGMMTQLVDENLRTFGLGEMTMWYREAKRDQGDSVEKSSFIIDSIKLVNQQLAKDPYSEVREMHICMSSCFLCPSIYWHGCLSFLLSLSPHSQDLKRQLKELQLRLEFAYKREDEAAQMKEQPLLYSKEFLALHNRDVAMFVTCFEKIDVDRKGYITVDEFFDYLEVSESGQVTG